MKSFWKKCKRYVTDRSNRVPVIFTAFGAVVVTAAVILVVRAYLTAQSAELSNPFGPMTYTDFEIGEVVSDPTSSQWAVESGAQENDKYNLNVNKDAFVTVRKTNQLKPVYVRLCVTTAVYESAASDASDAINISAQYPDVQAQWTLNTGDWTAKPSTDGTNTTFYYYNKIVLPEYIGTFTGDGSTTDIFASQLTILNAKKIPKGAEIRINVIADCVQAVSGDSSRWREEKDGEYPARFSTTEVQQAWGIAPTGTLPYVTATGNDLAITWSTS